MLFVHRVVGLPKGLYFLARKKEYLDDLKMASRSDFIWENPNGCPWELPLYELGRADWYEAIETSFVSSGFLGSVESSSRARAYLEQQCRPTLYSDLCVRTLLPFTKKNELPSPQKIAQISLTTCLAKARVTKAYVDMIAIKLNKTKNPEEYQALEECLGQINNGVNQITQSLKELQKMGKDGEEKFTWHESNVQSWVGAALTDATACMDGSLGDEIGSTTKRMIKARFLNVKELASNSLALLNRFTARHRASRAIKNP